MGWLTWTLVLLALAAAVFVATSAAKNPILARMAVRNAGRRPRQTATVIAGLMVGTAIVSAALVAGDSAGYAIRGYVYQSMGHIDESITIPGYSFYSDEVYAAFLDDPAGGDAFDGVTAFAIWEGTGTNLRTDLYEPSVFLVGFDQTTDATFGDFILTDGSRIDGDRLRPGQAILSDHAAAAMDVRVGDTVELAFTPPVDPVLPEIHPIAGNLTQARLPPLPGLPGTPSTATEARHVLPVGPNVTRIAAVVAFQPDAYPLLPATRLEMELLGPDGRTVAQHDPASDMPLWINITATPETVLAEGDWTLVLRADAAAEKPYAGVGIVASPVYDLAKLRARAEALQEEHGDLADRVDDLQPFSKRTTMQVEVAAIATSGRIDQFDLRSVAWLPLADAQSAFGREGQINYLAFSNPGGIESGVHGTESAMRSINLTLRDVQERFDGVPSIQHLEAKPEKQQFLAVADDTGQTMTGLLVFAGSLSIITGLLLILNIFTMLAEERRSELGMARAVGLGRQDLVRLFLFEGSLYAVAAAALGAVLGLGLAYGMIWVMNQIIAQLGQDLSIPPVTFRPSWQAILAAFGAGALLTFATIWGASRRQASLNIVRAIRRIEEPEKAGSWRAAILAGTPLLVLGGALTAIAWLPFWSYTGRFSMQVFGPLVAAAGFALMLRPLLRRRHLYPAIAAVVLTYYTATMFLITDFDDLQEANLVGPLRGVIITLAFVVLLVYFEKGTRMLGRALARVPRLRAVALPAVSYPLHKKFRTGMTLSMFAVVILSIGFFSIFGGLFDTDPERQTGGFDVEARTTLSIPDIAAYDRGLVDPTDIHSQHALVDFITEEPGFLTVDGGGTGRINDFRHHVYGYDAAFAADNGFRLLWRDEQYATDAEAYQAVLDRDDAVIVGYLYSTDHQNRELAYEVGDTLEMHLGKDSLPFTIIGIQEQYHFNGIWLPKELVSGLFPTVEGLYLYRTSDAVAAADLAQDLEQNYRDVGLEAKDSRAEVLREQASFRQILSAMKLFLGLGLLVGVLSLGIITSRSVLERRQEIGMLRALGFTARQVRMVFFVEVTYTLLLGAFAGVACAILVTYGLWFALIRELQYPYAVPWGEMGLLVLVSYVVALLATAAPIGRSAKVAPAEALRYVE